MTDGVHRRRCGTHICPVRAAAGQRLTSTVSHRCARDRFFVVPSPANITPMEKATTLAASSGLGSVKLQAISRDTTLRLGTPLRNPSSLASKHTISPKRHRFQDRQSANPLPRTPLIPARRIPAAPKKRAPTDLRNRSTSVSPHCIRPSVIPLTKGAASTLMNKAQQSIKRATPCFLQTQP